MIVLFTDFGMEGPYLGQVRAVLYELAPGVPIVDLMADAPRCDPEASACLLAAFIRAYPPTCHCLAVVDPGVGSERAPLIVQVDGRCFVGPDNGLFDRIAADAGEVRCWRIDHRPERLSRTFHGRDLFAPVVARLARGRSPDEFGVPFDLPVRRRVPDLERIIYIDRFGNAMTGIDGRAIDTGRDLVVAATRLGHAGTFAEVGVGEAFWYVNANGLVEIAVNRGSASERFGLVGGETVYWADTALGRE